MHFDAHAHLCVFIILNIVPCVGVCLTICLLCHILQESIMDFYWNYSNKDVIDESGKENFCRAIMVAKQVFCSLTEYIQVFVIVKI